MTMRVKICCISSVDEARMAVRAGADALGLVGEMPSGPGVIDDRTVREIVEIVPPPVATFLLTQRCDAASIAEHVLDCGTNTVQIVNHIEPIEQARLARLLPRAIRRVQVIHIEDRDALDLIGAYAPHVHAFLLDSGRPAADIPELGGTGRVHDWEISAEFVRRSPLPVFLAGGLNSANVKEAMERVAPHGLDLCSGVRTGDRLDTAKLSAFMSAARS